MSIHLLQCVARVTGISASAKLLLLCLADDSREGSGGRASPGLEELRVWSNLSASRVAEALKTLQELQLVHKVSAGHGTGAGRGEPRRAVYAVLPNGCCEAHGQEASASEASDGERVAPRPLTEPQMAARRANVERIAARRRAERPGSASDAQAAETPVDSPDLRMLSGSQHPKPTPSASEAVGSASEPSDPSQELPPQQSTPELSPPSDHSPARPLEEAAVHTPRPADDPAFGRIDWDASACRHVLRQVLAAGLVHDLAEAGRLLSALSTDPAVRHPGDLLSPAGIARARDLLVPAPRPTATPSASSTTKPSPAIRARPAWCGTCHEPTRKLEHPDTGVFTGNCPRCHPATETDRVA